MLRHYIAPARMSSFVETLEVRAEARKEFVENWLCEGRVVKEGRYFHLVRVGTKVQLRFGN